MLRARVIINPAAGGGRTARRWPQALLALRAADIDPDYVLTQRPGHAVALAEEAAGSEVDMVVALGGDGTAHEVANGLLRHESPPPLGLIQTGAGCDLARALGLPAGIEGQARLLATAQIQRWDVGVAEFVTSDGPRDRRFLLLAGVGLSAQVARAAPRFKWLRNGLPYYGAMLSAWWRLRAAEADVTLDGARERLRLFDLQVLNVPWVGGGLHVAPGADPRDGRLETLMTLEQSRLSLLALLPRVRSGAHVGRPGVRYGTAREVRVDTRPALPLQVDGEWVGETPGVFRVLPQALALLAGKGRSE